MENIYPLLAPHRQDRGQQGRRSTPRTYLLPARSDWQEGPHQGEAHDQRGQEIIRTVSKKNREAPASLFFIAPCTPFRFHSAPSLRPFSSTGCSFHSVPQSVPLRPTVRRPPAHHLFLIHIHSRRLSVRAAFSLIRRLFHPKPPPVPFSPPRPPLLIPARHSVSCPTSPPPASPRRQHLAAASISPSAAALRIRIPAPVRPLLRSRLRPRLRPIPARHSAGRIKHSLPLQAPVPGKQPPPLPGYSKKIPAPQTRRRDFSFSDRSISPPEYPC